MDKIWIGKYQSDMAYNDLFCGSFTYYGDNKAGNKACFSQDDRLFDENLYLTFIEQCIKQTLGKYTYIFYNQAFAYELIKLLPECKTYIRSINSYDLINWLSNKTLVRVWVQNLVSTPPFCILTGAEISNKRLSSLFPKHKSFIIQDNLSSGGVGTYLLSKSNTNVLSVLKNSQIYLVSPYISPSYSVNVHILVSANQQMVFQPSIQIIIPGQNNFTFRGSDFIGAQDITNDICKRLREISLCISEKLSIMGYRGICGLDFIVSKEEIYFIEINPRFQGSSFLINRTLQEYKLPSLYALNDMVFKSDLDTNLIDKLSKINVTYSYLKLKLQNEYSEDLIKTAKSCMDIDTLFLDGASNEYQSKSNGYIMRFICKRNLIMVNPNHEINIYQNLLFDNKMKLPIIKPRQWLELKVSILTQGIKINAMANKALKKSGGMADGTFDAIDLIFPTGMVINCPLKLPFGEFSPYTLDYENDEYALTYHNNKVSTVTVDKNDNITLIESRSGINIKRLVQRNNDRLRVRHNSICVFKEQNIGCMFCHAKNLEKYNYTLEDIEDGFVYYLTHFDFKHILIGGASNNRTVESDLIKSIIKIIRKHTTKPIYIMSLPPQRLSVVREYYQLGANEIAFNMEIYDELTALKLMPGKGKIPRDEYLTFLEEAVHWFTIKGSVRSMLIIGLESLDSFSHGIEQLCKIGVSPMISPFRPMKNTALEFYVPCTTKQCLEYVDEAIKICKKYKIELGPTCFVCQNNTLTLRYKS